MHDIDKYDELYNLIINHNWDKFKTKLLEYEGDIDVNIKDDKNNYLITYAITYNKIDIVRSLIDIGAKLDVLDNNNKSLLYIPIYYKYDDMLEFLIEKNTTNIGMSIINIKDNDHKTPLLYAIEHKNLFAIEKILYANGSPNITDNHGYNSLHLSIYTRNKKIIEKIVKRISNINSKCSTGETGLHIAANLQLTDICLLLIENNIDVNIQDHDHELTALHYVSTLGNLELTQLLLNNNANPNLQDVYGNTPLHYSLIEKNYSCAMSIINHNYNDIILNFNLWNYYSKLPLHILFDDFDENSLYYIDFFISKSNLSLKDINGNSILHHLAKNNLWRKYSYILENRKLNIFSKNINNLAPIDYIDDEDVDDFLSIVAKSYVNKLKLFGPWEDEFDDMCSKDYLNLNENDKKKLLKINSNIELNNFCIDRVKLKIEKLKKKYDEGVLECNDKTHPTKKNAIDMICKLQTTDQTLKFCTYTGAILDILTGIVYLLEKYDYVCSILGKSTTDNTQVCNFYRSLGIQTNNKCDFLNFEIVWLNYKLYVIDSFQDIFLKCLTKKRFVVVPLGIDLKKGSHANFIIYDSALKEVERFEPHGSTVPNGFNYNPDLLDEILKKRFESIDPSIKYIKPSEFLPKIGFQIMESNDVINRRIGDPPGFCALWSLWYIDMRLSNKDVDRKKLVLYLFKKIKDSNMSFKNLIRNYSKQVTNIRDELLEFAKMDINDWLNDNYTEEQLTIFMNNLDSRINKLI